MPKNDKPVYDGGFLVPAELTEAFLEIDKLGYYEGPAVTIAHSTLTIEEVCKLRGVPFNG